MRRIGLLAALLATTAASPAAAQSAQFCASRASLLERLASLYQEMPTAIGMSRTGAVIELLTSQSGRTWTLVVTTANGLACVLAAGEAWEGVPRPLDGVGL